MTTQQAADEQKAHQELLDNQVNVEWIQNAQFNLLTFAKQNPGANSHPQFKMGMEQLQNALGDNSMHDMV